MAADNANTEGIPMDDVDRAQRVTDAELNDSLSQIREKARLPKGRPGDCDLCGEWSGRLVNGACAPCRDKHNLP